MHGNKDEPHHKRLSEKDNKEEEKQDQSPQSPNRKSPHEEQQQWQKYLKREKNESLQDKQTLFSDEQKHKQMYMNITSKEKETFPHGVEEQILREQNENKLKDTTPAHTQEHIGKEREQDKLSEQYDIDKDVEMADVTQSEVNEGEKKEDRSSTYNLTMTDRTSSQRTNVQEFSIQKEETPDIPFIKPRITMKAFAKEYKNETIKRNIDRMRKKGYYWIVGTRGDGNCFYRAFVFQFFRWLLKHSRDGTSVLEIFKNFELFPTIRRFLTAMNETQMLKEMNTQFSNCRKALERFDKIENEVEFMEWMNDKIYSNAVVYLMRLIAAYELICDPETYRYFIPREDFNAYVLQNVIKMGEEAGDVEFTAIRTSMKKNLVLDPFLLDGFYPELRIVYLDRNERELPEYNYPLCTPKDMEPKDMEPETLTLLFRPGHYDVIL